MLDRDKILLEAQAMKAEIDGGTIMSKEVCQSKYNYLYTHTPTLFELIYKKGDVSIEQLQFMCQKAKSIERNEMSQYDADVIIGQKLADKYVTPIIENKENKEKQGN